jgi:DNA-binding MarR family transcriptional regulator
MRRLDRAVHEEVTAMLAEIGYPEVRIAHLLLFIHTPEEEGIRMSQLAERMQLTPGAVTQLVTHLERHGLMERFRDPTDGRAVIVRPTARTRTGYAAAWGRVGELLAGWEALAGPDRWDTFQRTLGDLVDWQEARVAARQEATRTKARAE